MKTMKKNKFNIKNLQTYQKYNIVAILICSFFIASLSVGYAILSQDLEIKGDIALRAQKDIRITAFGNFSNTNNGLEEYNAFYNEDSFTTSINLPEKASTVTYAGKITNNTSTAKKIKSITKVTYNNEQIVYEIIGAQVGKEIPANQTISFTVTFKYDPSITTISNNTLNSNIKFTFEDANTPTIDYATEGMLLDLRGTDAPIGNNWVDRVNNKNMQLINNPTYNTISSSYVFEGDARATLGEPILPETGDFTLEVVADFPIDIKTNTDQSIVAQLSDTTNDTGRFKLNFKYESNSKRVLAFYNDNVANTNKFLYGISGAEDSKKYVIQFVRSGDQYMIYIDGNLKAQQTVSTSTVISQGPFKLSYWNSSSKQNYHGSINAVRVYNRALTSDEIAANFVADEYYYKNITPVEKPEFLNDYIKNIQNSNNGGSIYQDNLGNYVYRGTAPTNYVKIAGSNNLYRIIGLNSDNTIKVIDTTNIYAGAFDNSEARDPLTSTYCLDAKTAASEGGYQGCNAWSASNTFTNMATTGTVAQDATINTYLNTTYYEALDSATKSKIVRHNFALGTARFGTFRDTVNTDSVSSLWNGNIGLPTAADVINAASTDQKMAQNLSLTNTWLLQGRTKEYFWTMTASNSNTFDVYTSLAGTQFSLRRASRTTQLTNTFYATPSFYIKADVHYQGTGSSTDPFIIE